MCQKVDLTDLSSCYNWCEWVYKLQLITAFLLRAFRKERNIDSGVSWFS